MSGETWKALKKDPRFKNLARGGRSKPSSCVMLVCHPRNHAPPHCDNACDVAGNFVRSKSAQREGTPTLVVTFGGARVLRFHRRHGKNGENGAWERPKKWSKGKEESFMEFCQEHGDALVLHPRDEMPLCRRDQHGNLKKCLQFRHRVNKPPVAEGGQHLSVALALHTVDNATPVNCITNRILVNGEAIKNYHSTPVKEQVEKRKRKCDEAMSNPSSEENQAAAATHACNLAKLRKMS